MQILLAEDNPRLADVTRRSLVEDGYLVDIATNGQEACDKSEVNDYDAIILDIMMPKIDGLTVCKMIRAHNTDIPIIMLTALGEPEDRIIGLDSGADDYLVKPFSFGELNARIRALLRRGKRADPIVLKVGKASFDTRTRIAMYNRTPLCLTARELALFQYLLVHRGRVIPKSELLEHVWDMNYQGLSNVLETYIRYLRKKIRDTGEKQEVIITIRGQGYRIG